MSHLQTTAPGWRVRTLTRGPHHHFFGYYGICPWDPSGRRLVCLETPFQDHLPTEAQAARIGLVDPRTGDFTPAGETHAWNFQQGAMLHWNPLDPEEILYNDRRDGEIISTGLNFRTGATRHLPRALNGISPDGRLALCLTYGRLTRMRPVVGYVGARDPHPDDPHPAEDGVFIMDLRTGESRLAVSIREVYERLVPRHPQLRGRHMWFNHTVFNRTGNRFFFLARSWTDEGRLESAMFTAAADGSDLREVIPYAAGVSHFEWRNDREILATFRLDGSMRHVLFTDGETDYRAIGDGVLLGDGHCSFASDGHRIVTDRNHEDTLEKSLWLYDLRTQTGELLGRFPMREKRFLGGDLRCDLHPRWSRGGDAVCFDALEPEGWTRQLHLAEPVEGEPG